MNNIIEVKNLTKKYKDLVAVNDISFEVKKGEVFGLLGENGAGKTTTLEIIEGLRKPTSGEISVLGHDIKHDQNSIKEKIGVQLQSSAYYSFLNLIEILELFGSFYQKKLDPIELLKMVELEKKSKSFVKNLSGGQKQRFSIIASLINDPDVVFLDEPTTGLDPIARRNLWSLISKIKSKGKTIILTTHYMEEAEVLCDRVAIMDNGKILALDLTHRLIEQSKNPIKVNFVAKLIPKNIEQSLQKIGQYQRIVSKEYHSSLKLQSHSDLILALNLIQKIKTESLTICRSSLEDVFIELTGKNIEE